MSQTKQTKMCVEWIERGENQKLSDFLDLISMIRLGRLTQNHSFGHLLKVLVTNEFDVNFQMYKDYGYRTTCTLLDHAIRYKNVDAVKLLIHHGADVKGVSRNTSYANIAASVRSLPIMKILYEYGAPLNTEPKIIGDNRCYDFQHAHPICTASALGFNDVVEFIVDKCGKEILSKMYKYSYTPIMAAASAGHLSTVKLLHQLNDECILIKAQTYDCNAIGIAIKYGKLDVLKYLFSVVPPKLTKHERFLYRYKRVYSSTDVYEEGELEFLNTSSREHTGMRDCTDYDTLCYLIDVGYNFWYALTGCFYVNYGYCSNREKKCVQCNISTKIIDYVLRTVEISRDEVQRVLTFAKSNRNQSATHSLKLYMSGRHPYHLRQDNFIYFMTGVEWKPVTDGFEVISSTPSKKSQKHKRKRSFSNEPYESRFSMDLIRLMSKYLVQANPSDP